MTSRLVIHLPNSTITIDSDNIDKLTRLSNFCKEIFGAFHATENVDEITVTNMSEEEANNLSSFILELGII